MKQGLRPFRTVVFIAVWIIVSGSLSAHAANTATGIGTVPAAATANLCPLLFFSQGLEAQDDATREFIQYMEYLAGERGILTPETLQKIAGSETPFNPMARLPTAVLTLAHKEAFAELISRELRWEEIREQARRTLGQAQKNEIRRTDSKHATQNVIAPKIKETREHDAPFPVELKGRHMRLQSEIFTFQKQNYIFDRGRSSGEIQIRDPYTGEVLRKQPLSPDWSSNERYGNQIYVTQDSAYYLAHGLEIDSQSPDVVVAEVVAVDLLRDGNPRRIHFNYQKRREQEFIITALVEKDGRPLVAVLAGAELLLFDPFGTNPDTAVAKTSLRSDFWGLQVVGLKSCKNKLFIRSSGPFNALGTEEGFVSVDLNTMTVTEILPSFDFLKIFEQDGRALALVSRSRHLGPVAQRSVYDYQVIDLSSGKWGESQSLDTWYGLVGSFSESGRSFAVLKANRSFNGGKFTTRVVDLKTLETVSEFNSQNYSQIIPFEVDGKWYILEVDVDGDQPRNATVYRATDGHVVAVAKVPELDLSYPPVLRTTEQGIDIFLHGLKKITRLQVYGSL